MSKMKEIPKDITRALDRAMERTHRLSPLAQAMAPAQKRSTLYHYTSAQGLIGILTHNCLWASHWEFLNDTEELRHGVNIVQRTVEELIGVSSDATERAFLQHITEQVSSLASSPPARWFLVCLSEEPDSLGQWRGYAERGSGYTIGLNPDGIEGRHLDPFLHLPTICWVLPVVYQQSEQENTVRLILGAFLDEIANCDFTGEHHGYLANFEDQAIASVGNWLLQFKHPAFEEEREHRIVISVRDQASLTTQCRFRAYSAGIVPYLEFGLPAADTQSPVTPAKQKFGPLPITEIWCGPNCNRERIEKSARLLLDVTGYGDVPIHHSRVP